MLKTVSLEDWSSSVTDEDSKEENFGIEDGSRVKGSLIRNQEPPPMLVDDFEDLEGMRG